MHITLGWDDLLFEDATLDYEALLDDWRWILNGRFRVVAGTKFGDWFMERPDGQVQFLDAIDGTIREVATSTVEFRSMINTQEKQEEWLLSPLVLTLHENGVVPASGQCYGFKLPPVLGGKVESDNVEVIDLRLWVSLCGQIHRQVQSLPPGTKISGFKTEG